MMKDIVSLEESQIAKSVFYGGNAGAKEAIIHENSVWMIKYPKTTRDLSNPQISYTTSPLSEYIASKIYKSLKIPVHEVILGVRKKKIVVACKDFTREIETGNEIKILKPRLLIPFHDLKNNFMSSDLEEYSGTGSETILEEVLDTLTGEATLKSIKDADKRFWDMFIVDAFIGNSDRNNGNWGLLWHVFDGSLTLAPVYDNGNGFYNKRSLKQMEKRLSDEKMMKEDAYGTPVSVYKYKGLDNEGHRIKSFEFIEKTEILACRLALQRFLDNVDMNLIRDIINEIPESKGVLAVMPEIQKKFYIRLLEIRLDRLQSIV